MHTEGNVLFNDTLNTFYLRLYGVRHMVKNHSYMERGNPLPQHGLLFPISRITHTTAFVTPVVGHWLKREIAQWVHHEGSIQRPIAPRANALTTELHLAPFINLLASLSNTSQHTIVVLYISVTVDPSITLPVCRVTARPT